MIMGVGSLALIFGSPLLGVFSMGGIGAGTVLTPSLLILLMTFVITRPS